MRRNYLSIFALLCLVIISTAPILLCENEIFTNSGEDSDNLSTRANTLNVGYNQTYKTIQSAVNAAQPDDIISIQPGTYSENVTLNKTLKLDGNNNLDTVIDGGITIEADDCRIYDLRIYNEGISIESNNNRIVRCVVEPDELQPDYYRERFQYSNGINIKGAYNIIEECIINFKFYGVNIEEGFHNEIQDTITKNNGKSGIRLQSKSYHTLIGNCTSSSNDQGITIESSYNNTIVDSEFSFNDDEGIDMFKESYGNRVFDSWFTKNNCGIRCRESPLNLFQNITLINTGLGIYLSESNFCRFEKVMILEGFSSSGMKIIKSDYTTISECIVSDTSIAGIKIAESKYCNITDSIVRNCGIGFNIQGESKGTVIEDCLSFRNVIGIKLEGAENTTTRNNLLLRNRDYGIQIDQYTTNNMVYSNYFINNHFRTVQAYDHQSGNIWDDGIDKGNFWNDYERRFPNSTNNGEIWNKPYVMNEAYDNNPKDNYPRVMDNISDLIVSFGLSSSDMEGNYDDTDSAGDGLPDMYEVLFLGGLDSNPEGDLDEDGFTNWEEYINGTRPDNSTDYPKQRAIGNDLDNDGLPDDWEEENFGDLNQEPTNDYDEDGMTNIDEYNNGSDPADKIESPVIDTDDDEEQSRTVWNRLKESVGIIGLVTLLIFLTIVVIFVIILYKRQDQSIGLSNDITGFEDPQSKKKTDSHEMIKKIPVDLKVTNEETDRIILELKGEVIKNKLHTNEKKAHPKEMLDEFNKRYESGELDKQTYNLLKTKLEKKIAKQ